MKLMAGGVQDEEDIRNLFFNNVRFRKGESIEYCAVDKAR